MKKRPKTGERRQVRQPLKIDKLPQAMRDRIQTERDDGRTWMEIEVDSPLFREWEAVPGEIKQLFPGCVLPHTTLQRWWDLRIDQVREEVMRQADAAKELAKAFAGRKFDELPEAVMNALRDLIFSVLQESDGESRGKAIKALLSLGLLVSDLKKTDVQEKRLAVEERRVGLSEREFEIKKRKFDAETTNAAKKLGQGKPITTDDINRIRERTFGLPPVTGSPAA